MVLVSFCAPENITTLKSFSSDFPRMYPELDTNTPSPQPCETPRLGHPKWYRETHFSTYWSSILPGLGIAVWRKEQDG